MTIQVPQCADGAIDFPETAYGIVKRLRTIERWAALVGEWSKKDVLSILDYGCGTGDHVTYPLACLGHCVLGVDYHTSSIAEAGRRFSLPNLSFRVTDIDLMVREGAVFDLVICSEVLEHLREPLPFLRKVIRLIDKTGGFVVTTPNGYGSFEWLCSLERVLDRIGVNNLLRKARRAFRRGATDEQANGRSPDTPATIGFLNMDSRHVQFFRLAELESLFAHSGFRIVDRQARTIVCGPYADSILQLMPWRQSLYRLNNEAADRLPMTWAADWMYLLRPDGTIAT